MFDPISLATGLFSSGKNMALIGVGIVGSIGWTMWYFEDQAHMETISDAAAKIERAENNTRVAEDALHVSNETILTMRRQQLDDYEQKLKDDAQVAEDRRELDRLRTQLDSYRKRWENVATKKPGLLARVINRATIKRMRVIEAATCRTACDTDGSGGDSTQPRQPAGSSDSQ